MTPKRVALIPLLAAVLTLTGCAYGGSPQNDSGAGGKDPSLYERTIVLKDGRTLDCVEYDRGGLSCDWGHTS